MSGENGEGSLLSEKDEVNGTEPVRRTVNMPRVINAIPRERLKYSSITDGSRTSGESKVIMMVGEVINGAACRANQPAVPYVYA